jgi:nicotinate-nucleotide adenylyltransferase
VLILPKWHRAQELLDLVRFVVMARPGVDINWKSLPQRFQVLRGNLVEAPLVDISSTDIRQRVRQGLPIDHLTPPGVVRYIQEHRLYQPK